VIFAPARDSQLISFDLIIAFSPIFTPVKLENEYFILVFYHKYNFEIKTYGFFKQALKVSQGHKSHLFLRQFGVSF